MPAIPMVVVALLGLSTAVGAVGLAFTPEPLETDAALLVVAAGAVFAVVAAAGILLARGRWARLAAVLVGGLWAGVGAAMASDWGWVTMVTGAALLATGVGPWLGSWLRQLPSLDGPPRAAVALLLTLLATPAAIGLTHPEGIPTAGWILATWSIALAVAVSRAIPGALLALRFAHPVVSLGLGVTLEPAGAILVTGAGALVTAAAWRREVGVALVPRVPTTATDLVRIPPELADPELLDAAGLDDRGRPRSI